MSVYLLSVLRIRDGLIAYFLEQSAANAKLCQNQDTETYCVLVLPSSNRATGSKYRS